MAYSLADHVRLAREAWERGHSLVLSALASIAASRGIAIQADALPKDHGNSLQEAYRDFVRHLRPLEPYLSGLPLVDEIRPWRCRLLSIEPTQPYGGISYPKEVDGLSEETWKSFEAEIHANATEWRARFDGLAKAFEVKQPLTNIEECVLEAVGDKTLTGPEIARASGYEYTAYLRKTLKSMVDNGLLIKAPKGFGYLRNLSPDNQ